MLPTRNIFITYNDTLHCIAPLCTIKMSSRTNYRVKVDLTKYHRDARRFSWIYVDCTNVWLISHVKQHITDIFGTKEPFHLLLNGKDYLPPTEDVRVLKENELISVVPGTGISEANDLTMHLSGKKNNSFVINHTAQPMDTSITDCNIDKCKIMSDAQQNGNKSLEDLEADVSMIDATMYHSIWEKTEVENTPNTKTTDENSTLNCSTTDPDGAPIHKRKRIRRKRSKHSIAESQTETKDHKQQSVYHNTKPLHLPVVPTGKHIHFDNANDRVSTALENDANERAVENEKRKTNSSSPPTANKKTKVDTLSTLLALRQTSTPLMFVNKKLKHTSENNSDDTTKSHDNKIEICSNLKDAQISQDVESNGNKSVNETTEIPSDYSNLDPEKYPSLESAPGTNDVIAFKILKIGNEYTPEVSEYIVAKTISWCPKKLLFTFQILSGQMQIQTPLGKFSLPSDESEDQICDTANFNFSQLIDPRLIYRK